MTPKLKVYPHIHVINGHKATQNILLYHHEATPMFCSSYSTVSSAQSAAAPSLNPASCTRAGRGTANRSASSAHALPHADRPRQIHDGQGRAVLRALLRLLVRQEVLRVRQAHHGRRGLQVHRVRRTPVACRVLRVRAVQRGTRRAGAS